jgi:hypothetical protein
MDIIIMHIVCFVTHEQCSFPFLEPMNFHILVVTQKRMEVQMIQRTFEGESFFSKVPIFRQ